MYTQFVIRVMKENDKEQWEHEMGLTQFKFREELHKVILCSDI